MLVKENTKENKKRIYVKAAIVVVAVWIVFSFYSFLSDIFSFRTEIKEIKLEIYDISGLQELTNNIYKTGEVESSVYALEYYISKLEIDREKYEPSSPSFDSVTSELGLAHARLYSLYEKKGERELSQKEYNKSIEFIGDKFNINTPFELHELLKRLD